ncbi:MAG: hypothetical protein LIP11_17045 [Clostridiales bacterium]|nr:hypothetical protein [Clostridiales bacterium]
MDVVQELQYLKAELIQEINEKMGQMIQKLEEETQNHSQNSNEPEQAYELIYPLNAGTGIFKGKHPTGIIFSNGIRKDVPTWKKVIGEILKDCCEDAEKRQALMHLRGKVFGRNRVLLGSEKGSMRSPLQIADALYVETHYDTETLLRIITTRILDTVEYNYSEIRIAVRAD